MKNADKGVVILSGGLDSTTLLYDALNHDVEITSCVAFNYGQRHSKEIGFAQATCDKLDIQLHVISLWSSGFTEAIAAAGSSLTTSNEVPDGHYAAENMQSTVVPNRNMVMISIAVAVAVAEYADTVFTGVHAGDHFIYPDCRKEFISAVGVAARLANEGFGAFQRVSAPYADMSKADIAYRALELDVPLDETWSCYKGGDVHCGRCGTCVERLESIDVALKAFGGRDNTKYADLKYWKEVTK